MVTRSPSTQKKFAATCEKLRPLIERLSLYAVRTGLNFDEAKKELGKVANERDRQRHDLQRQIDRIYGDLDYLKQEKLSLLRAKTMSPEEYTERYVKLENEYRDAQAALANIHESEKEMLKYVLTFSELVKRAGLYYKYALDVETHQIITQVFTELRFSSNEFSFVAKDGYLALFSRHDKKKTHHATHDVYSGSLCWTRSEPSTGEL